MWLLLACMASFGLSRNVEAYPVSHPVYSPTGQVAQLLSQVAPYLELSDVELRNHIEAIWSPWVQYDSNEENLLNHQNYMTLVTYNLALLYHLTPPEQVAEREDYAHRTTVVLARYAEVFPGWVAQYLTWLGSKSRLEQGNSLWDLWCHGDLSIPVKLAEAFDLIYNSQAIADDRAIIEEFLREVVRNDLTLFPRLYVFNYAYYRPQALAAFGRILGDPELVHLGIWYLDKSLHEQYCFDGFHDEATYSYHLQATSRFLLPNYCFYFDGYSDPAEYVHEPFEERYDAPRIENYQCAPRFTALWERMRSSLYETVLPNQHFPVINDTAYYGYAYPGTSAPPRSRLLAGIGHAALAFGQGADQVQARLDFSHTRSHAHGDALHLIYFDKGTELIGGTGYNRGSRWWNTSSFNQNLVTVNRIEQRGGALGSAYWIYYTDTPYTPVPGSPGGLRRPVSTCRFAEYDANCSSSQNLERRNLHNNVLLWEPGYGGDNRFQAIEVDAAGAYTPIEGELELEQYQRFLSMVNVTESDVYLLDIFRVKGGTSYQWNQHGGHSPYSISTSLDLLPASGILSGITLRESVTTADNWHATFDYGAAKGRTHLAESPGTIVYRGTGMISPRESDSTLPVPTQDYLVVERQSPASQGQVFMAVHEGFSTTPRVQRIETLEFESDPGSARGLAVHLDNGTVDYMVHTLDGPEDYPEHRVRGVPNFAVRGRVAHVRVTNGVPQWLKLLDGVSLSYDGTLLQAAQSSYSYGGLITAVSRVENGAPVNSFETDQLLPQDGSLDGKTLIVSWGNSWKWAYTIGQIDGYKIITADEPGFDYEAGIVKMRYFPVGEFPGPISFSIPGSAYLDSAGQLLATAPSVLPAVDECVADPLKIRPGLCGCGQSDRDSDSDDSPDCQDTCVHDPLRAADPGCGCGVPYQDADRDGVEDCTDRCPEDPEKQVLGLCGCGVSDNDSDRDGVADCQDVCPQGALEDLGSYVPVAPKLAKKQTSIRIRFAPAPCQAAYQVWYRLDLGGSKKVFRSKRKLILPPRATARIRIPGDARGIKIRYRYYKAAPRLVTSKVSPWVKLEL